MKRGFLTSLKEFLRKRSKKPWAAFETSGPDAEGRLEFTMSWNNSFVNRLKSVGYEADSEEEMVQMFFISTAMIPENLVGDDSINPSSMPKLSSEANYLKR